MVASGWGIGPRRWQRTWRRKDRKKCGRVCRQTGANVQAPRNQAIPTRASNTVGTIGISMTLVWCQTPAEPIRSQWMQRLAARPCTAGTGVSAVAYSTSWRSRGREWARPWLHWHRRWTSSDSSESRAIDNARSSDSTLCTLAAMSSYYCTCFCMSF